MMVVANLARGDAGAIEDAFEKAWQLQRDADWLLSPVFLMSWSAAWSACSWSPSVSA